MKFFLFLLFLASAFAKSAAHSQGLSIEKLSFKSSDLWDLPRALVGPRAEQKQLQTLLMAYQKWPQFTDEEWNQALDHLRTNGPAQFNAELHVIWSSQSMSNPRLQRTKTAEALLGAGRFSDVLLLLSDSEESLDLELIKVEAAVLAGQVDFAQDLVAKLLDDSQFDKMNRSQKIYALLLNSWICHLKLKPLEALIALERARYLWTPMPQPEYFRLALIMSSLDFLRREFPLIPAQLNPYLNLDSASRIDLFRAQYLIYASRRQSSPSSSPSQLEIRPIKDLFQRGLQFESAFIRFGFLDALWSNSSANTPEEKIRIAKLRLAELMRLQSSRSLEFMIDQYLLESAIHSTGPKNK